MGKPNDPSQTSDQTAPEPNHYDSPYISPPSTYMAADNDQNVKNSPSTRSYVPQTPDSMPPPEAYPPPQQPPPEAYPPPQQPTPEQYLPPNLFYVQPMENNPTQPGIVVGSQYVAPIQGRWSARNGLFDCAEDSENAIITTFLPCVTFGQIAEIVDNGQTSCSTSGLICCLITLFIGIPCIMTCKYRTKIRSQFGLIETPAPDWVTHFFCHWCALCQEFRELKARGLDPAIGWQGNMIMKNQQYSAMTPPMNQTMI